MTVDVEQSEIGRQLLFISSSAVEEAVGDIFNLVHNKHFNSRAIQHIVMPTSCTAIRAWEQFSYA